MPPFDHDEARRARSGRPGPVDGPGPAVDGASWRPEDGDRSSAGRGSADRNIVGRIQGFRPRSLKGATGLGIAGAALLLFPFLDDPNRWWVPAGLGLGSLVLLTLLRLDHLLKGWTWHVAGLVLLAALVSETSRNPWAWAFAPSIGLLIAGLLRLPRWRLAALGGVACVLAIVGYQFRAVEVRQEEAAAAVQAGESLRTGFGYDRPGLLVEALGIGLLRSPPEADAFCRRLVIGDAAAQVLQATGVGDCPAAVEALHDRVPLGAKLTAADKPGAPGASSGPPGSSVMLDSCGSIWAQAAPSLGRIIAVRTDAPSETWQLAGFAPCP